MMDFVFDELLDTSSDTIKIHTQQYVITLK